MFDRGTEFMAEFSKMCQNDYGLKRKPITTRNPHSNAIIKRIHQTIGNFSKRDVSRIIKDFEKIEKLLYDNNRPKHEPTDSYFHLVRQIVKCMMRSDKLNRHDHGSYAVNNALPSNVNATNEDESKEIIMHETLSENNSKDVSESECNISSILYRRTTPRTYQRILLRN